MNTSVPRDGLQLRSLVKDNGELELSLARVPTPEPAADEVVVRVEAAPINPSDLGLLFGAADLATLAVRGSGERTVATARVPDAAMKAMAARLGQSMPVGNEGAGAVVAAGASAAAQALLGKTVAVLGGAMYAQYRTVKAELSACRCPPAPAPPKARRASSIRSPRSAWSRRCGAKATRRSCTPRRRRTSARCSTALPRRRRRRSSTSCASPSRRSCCASSARRTSSARASPALHATSSPRRLVATGATLAFDAIGGGKLAGQILGAMEAALNRKAKEYSRYGSTTHKQVYIYGGLDTGPTELVRNFGMAWGIGGWLLTPFLQKIGARRRASAQGARRRRDQDHVREPLHARRLARRGAAGSTRSPTTAGARPAPRC